VKPYILVAAASVVLGAMATAPLALPDRALIACVIAVLLAVCALRDGHERGTLCALAVATLLVGAGDAYVQRTFAPVVAASHTARYSGTVLGDVQMSSEGVSFAYAIDNGPAVLVSARGAPISSGERLLVRGRLEPFDDARNPDEPSERDLQRERGFQARIAAAQVLAHLSPAGDWRALLARARGWALAQLRARLPDLEASLIAGALWGERGTLPPDVRAEFQETGTVHVLVTAGLHLGVVVALALWALTALRAPRTLACSLAIACAWSYAIFAGAHTPSMRAATMLTFALTARACGYKALSWNALAAAALVLALLRPLDVAGTSFLLSFSCVGAILACASALDRWLEMRMAIPHRVREAIAVAAATQLGTWPLTAAVFLQFAPYALLANVLVVPTVGAAMLLAGAQLALAWCEPLAQACANLASWCLAWMLAVVSLLASFPFAKIPMTPAPSWCIALYDAALLALPILWRRGGRTLAAGAFAVAVALVVWPPRAVEHQLRVTVLDVGQADSIVVQTPGGHVLLIDGGGQLERGPQTPGDSSAERVGERIVVPFLLRHGIHAVDTIVLSHPHGDHAGGVAPVLRDLGAGTLADSGQRYGGAAYRDATDVAHQHGVAIVYPRAGGEWRSDDGVTLHFIGPSLPFIAGGSNDINDNSVAFVLEYRGFRMLFTGDAGVLAERRFLATGIDLHADVLKVGHHGSAYSSTPDFIAAVHPKYAIVSVGRYNHFGHPAPRTIAILERIGARVYRTDQDRAISITTDGRSLTVLPLDSH
jgi:competence protein ComEC